MIDEFLRKADLDRLAAGRSAWGRWLKLANTFTAQVSVRHDLRERMDGIKDRLKEISNNVDKYLLENKNLLSSNSSAPNYSISTAASWYAYVSSPCTACFQVGLTRLYRVRVWGFSRSGESSS